MDEIFGEREEGEKRDNRIGNKERNCGRALFGRGGDC